MTRWLALGLALGGCSLPLQWDDVPTATVTPVLADPSYDETTWTIEVATAVGGWNEALVELGCPPAFELGSGGHPITLIAEADWAHGNDVGFARGDGLWFDPGYIEIKNRMADHVADLIHELGHAMGLGHSDNAFGPSIMGRPINGVRVMPRDAAAAACVLGCGSCDLDDHFTGD